MTDDAPAQLASPSEWESFLELVAPSSGAGHYLPRINQHSPSTYAGVLGAFSRAGLPDPRLPIGGVGQNLPLAAAWLSMVDIDAEVLETLHDLWPTALSAVLADGTPSLGAGVTALIERFGAFSENPKDQDQTLATWCLHIPSEHYGVFDAPGDAFGAGLVFRLRQAGDFPATEAVLAQRGVDLNGVLANGLPLAAALRQQHSWERFLARGGDPFAPTPKSLIDHGVSRPLALWELLAIQHKHVLLPTLIEWARSLPANPAAVAALERLESMALWRRIDEVARTKTRDELVAFLGDLPNAFVMTDNLGRNVLQRLMGKQPALLTTVLRTKKWNRLLHHRDSGGRSALAYALPALSAYSRSSDARGLLAELSQTLPLTRQALNPQTGSGFHIDWWSSFGHRPDGAPYGQSVDRQLRKTFSSELLWGGEPPEQARAAQGFLRALTQSPQDASASLQQTIASLAATLIECEGQHDRSARHEFHGGLDNAVVFGMLYGTRNASNDKQRSVTLDAPLMNRIEEALRDGLRWPDLGVDAQDTDPVRLLESLREDWSNKKIFNGSDNYSTGVGSQRVLALLDRWIAQEMRLRLDTQTSPAPSPRASGGLRL